MIRLLDSVGDGPRDGVRGECSFAQITEQLLGRPIGDVIAELCRHDSGEYGRDADVWVFLAQAFLGSLHQACGNEPPRSSPEWLPRAFRAARCGAPRPQPLRRVRQAALLRFADAT